MAAQGAAGRSEFEPRGKSALAQDEGQTDSAGLPGDKRPRLPSILGSRGFLRPILC